jgi:hypothetical protein
MAVGCFRPLPFAHLVAFGCDGFGLLRFAVIVWPVAFSLWRLLKYPNVGFDRMGLEMRCH